MMFGYAIDETPEFMPATISYSHKLLKRLSELRRLKHVPFLRPDAKSHVTIEYKDGKMARVDTVVISTQHAPDVSSKELETYVIEECIKRTIPSELLKNTRYLVNPTGRFVIGGPQGDCGLTGRKIIVDTYGGMGRHGGGAFSGKDATKVDRSASYAARWVAKHIVASGLARRCEVQLAYAIGVAEPVSVRVETFGTGAVPDSVISCAVSRTFDLTPAGIIGALELRRPIFLRTAAYGHFGRTPERSADGTQTYFPWEQTDRVDALRAAAGS
jgi:S-adenosylmethionine synthetase